MKKLILTVAALAMISILSWLYDVFGRTLTPEHPRHVQRTWDGNVMVVQRAAVSTSYLR